MPDRTREITNLVRQLLDRGYTDATGAVINAIARNGSAGVMGRRLDDLEAEAARLAAQGKKLTPDNPAVRALMADFEDTMRANRALVNSVADDVQLTGIDASAQITRQLSIPGFTDAQLAGLGVRWNVPDPEAVMRLVDYVQSDAFAAKLGAYEAGTVDRVQGILVRTFVEGYTPRRAAGVLRDAVEGLPASYANQMLRTLQLTTLRDAQVVHRVANRDILEYQIRVAALDDRTCPTCVALHGTELPIEARIDDHHNGRCTSITKVKFLDAPTVQSGEAWFAAQPESRQRTILGQSAFESWQNGSVTLRDFVSPYTDTTYGTMMGSRSLRKIFAGIDGEFDYTPPQPDYFGEAKGIIPGMIETGVEGDMMPHLSEFFAYAPDGTPIYSATAVRTSTVDLFVDVRQIGRVDPSLAQVDVIRQRAAAVLSANEQLSKAVLSKAERDSLMRMVSTDYSVSTAEILEVRDLRLRGQRRGITAGYSSGFVSAQDADSIAQLLEYRRGY